MASAVIDSFIHRLSSNRWPTTIQAHNNATKMFIETTEVWSDVAKCPIFVTISPISKSILFFAFQFQIPIFQLTPQHITTKQVPCCKNQQFKNLRNLNSKLNEEKGGILISATPIKQPNLSIIKPRSVIWGWSRIKRTHSKQPN